LSQTQSKSSAKRRLSSTDATKPKKRSGTKDQADDFVARYLGDDDGPDSFKQLRLREVKAKEQEANARTIEAEAVAKKTKSEMEVLSIQASATLLRERKRLLEEGVSQEDIDALLLLKKTGV
jgi:hypothetical protein